MAERSRQPQPADLERALSDLGARLAYPPTPDLARAVRGRLVAAPPPRRPFWAAFAPAPRRLALALVALALLLAAILGAVPATRTAIADYLGLRGIRIVYVTPSLPAALPPTATPAPPTPTAPPTATVALAAASPATPTSTPTPTPRPTATPRPTPTPCGPAPTPTPPPGTPASLGDLYQLGRRVTLAEARAQVQFPVVVPDLPDLGPPDEVYVSAQAPGGMVSLVWHARPGTPPAGPDNLGLLLTEFQGKINQAILGKMLDPCTTLEQVTVKGNLGFWIAGRPHEFFYLGPAGQFTSEPLRLAGNTLVWTEGDVTFRLEGARTKDEALRVAAATTK
ncbi:MAG TPA: hypothetical protein VFW96_16150 [Thermomicrobiales bacterium]|nr:hypothetical protein [Thermomicrobiales bacterium]